MTRQSTIDRARQLDRSGIACVGRYTVGGQFADFVLSEDDLARDAEWMKGILAGYGVQRGNNVLVTSLAWEVPWYEQVRVATGLLDAVHSNAEVWGWDAPRLDMFARRLDLQLVVGLSGDTVSSLANIVDPAERLGPVPHLLVQRDALEPLREAGLEPGLVVPVGPALLVSAPDGSGLCFNEAEWVLEERGGELMVTTAGPRAARFNRECTGVAGHMADSPGGARVVLG